MLFLIKSYLGRYLAVSGRMKGGEMNICKDIYLKGQAGIGVVTIFGSFKVGQSSLFIIFFLSIYWK